MRIRLRTLSCALPDTWRWRDRAFLLRWNYLDLRFQDTSKISVKFEGRQRQHWTWKAKLLTAGSTNPKEGLRSHGIASRLNHGPRKPVIVCPSLYSTISSIHFILQLTSIRISSFLNYIHQERKSGNCTSFSAI